MELLMPSTMSTEAAIGYAERLYKDDYRHWNAPSGWCREAASLLLHAFGIEAQAYHYSVTCRRDHGPNWNYDHATGGHDIEHVVVVYKGLAFDLTRGQFGKGMKRIIGEDVSILEELYGQPVNIQSGQLS